MRPSQVRKRILSDHVALRAQLDELAKVTARLGQEPQAAMVRAVELAQALYEDLNDHMDLEDEILAPVLRERDSWGPVRADRLQEHHVSQREQLRVLTAEETAALRPDVLARSLSALVEELRADMAYEERELLDPSAIDDDLVSADGEDG